jgi:hypothetical protein
MQQEASSDAATLGLFSLHKYEQNKPLFFVIFPVSGIHFPVLESVITLKEQSFTVK